MLQVVGAPSPADFIPLFGMVTGVVTVVAIGYAIVRVAQSQVGQAVARRIQGKTVGDPELREELYQLREEVATLERRLLETEERLDFTERLLSRPVESEGPARPSLDRH